MNAEPFNTTLTTNTSFNPPLDEQLWTPLQQKYRARGRGRAQTHRPTTPTPVREGEEEEAGLATGSAEDGIQVVSAVHKLYQTGHAWRAIKPEPPVLRSQTPTQQSLTLEFSPKLDYSPSSSNQPPSPVILKAVERRRLEAHFRGQKASHTSSADTLQRILRGYEDTTATSRAEQSKVCSPGSTSQASASLYSEIDPAKIVRPQAPEPSLPHHWLHASAQEDLSTSAVTKRPTFAYSQAGPDPAPTPRLFKSRIPRPTKETSRTAETRRPQPLGPERASRLTSSRISRREQTSFNFSTATGIRKSVVATRSLIPQLRRQVPYIRRPQASEPVAPAASTRTVRQVAAQDGTTSASWLTRTQRPQLRKNAAEYSHHTAIEPCSILSRAGSGSSRTSSETRKSVHWAAEVYSPIKTLRSVPLVVRDEMAKSCVAKTPIAETRAVEVDEVDVHPSARATATLQSPRLRHLRDFVSGVLKFIKLDQAGEMLFSSRWIRREVVSGAMIRQEVQELMDHDKQLGLENEQLRAENARLRLQLARGQDSRISRLQSTRDTSAKFRREYDALKDQLEAAEARIEALHQENDEIRDARNKYSTEFRLLRNEICAIRKRLPH